MVYYYADLLSKLTFNRHRCRGENRESSRRRFSFKRFRRQNDVQSPTPSNSSVSSSDSSSISSSDQLSLSSSASSKSAFPTNGQMHQSPSFCSCCCNQVTPNDTAQSASNSANNQQISCSHCHGSGSSSALSNFGAASNNFDTHSSISINSSQICQEDGNSLAGYSYTVNSETTSINDFNCCCAESHYSEDGNIHAEKVLKRIQSYLGNARYCDVTLIPGGDTDENIGLHVSSANSNQAESSHRSNSAPCRIPAHRVILAAGSDYFAAMFGGNQEANTGFGEAVSHSPTVTIGGVGESALRHLVSYLYTGRLPSAALRPDNVERLLSAASLLQVTDVIQACSRYLIQQLHPSNCIGISQFAHVRNCTHLYDAAVEYILEHFSEVIQHSEFVDLPIDQLTAIISSDKVNVTAEELVYEAILRWVEHDPSKRQPSMGRLLSYIRLPLIPAKYLIENVQSNALVRESRESLSLLLDAMNYHALRNDRTSSDVLSTSLSASLLLSDSNLAAENSTATCSDQDSSSQTSSSSYSASNRHSSTALATKVRPRLSTIGQLYAVGGNSNKGATSLERYDPRKDEWHHVTSMSSGGRRLQFGVAVMDDGKLYVVGGRDGLKTLNTVECYNPAKKSWSLLPPMATHRHGPGVAVLGSGNDTSSDQTLGPLYAVGGHDGWSYLATVERWDPESRQWAYVAPMNSARSTAGVAALGGRLYAVGGKDGTGCLRSVERFDPHTNRWTVVAPMAKRRGCVGVAVCDGYLYAVGGGETPSPGGPTATSTCRFACVERYDPVTDTWTTISSLFGPPRDAIAVCSAGGRVYATGGYDGQNCRDDVEVYDPQTNHWSKLAHLTTPRAGACLIALLPKFCFS